MGRFTDCFSVNCVFLTTLVLVLAGLVPFLLPAPQQPILTAMQQHDYRNFHNMVQLELANIESNMAAAPEQWQGRTKADIDDIDFGHGRRIMHMAGLHGDVNIVRYLHKRGASLHVVKTDDLRTPLHFAATFNTEEVVETMIKLGAKVDAKALYGWTPLLKAILLSNHAIVSALLRAGADPNAAVEGSFNGMQCALMYSDERMGMLLLRAGGYVEEGERYSRQFEELKQTLLRAGLVEEAELDTHNTFERNTANTKGAAATGGEGKDEVEVEEGSQWDGLSS